MIVVANPFINLCNAQKVERCEDCLPIKRTSLVALPALLFFLSPINASVIVPVPRVNCANLSILYEV